MNDDCEDEVTSTRRWTDSQHGLHFCSLWVSFSLTACDCLKACTGCPGERNAISHPVRDDGRDRKGGERVSEGLL